MLKRGIAEAQGDREGRPYKNTKEVRVQSCPCTGDSCNRPGTLVKRSYACSTSGGFSLFGAASVP